MNQEISSPQQSIDNKFGYLIIHATTAGGAIPLEGVQILVRSYEQNNPDNKGEVLRVLITDRDGNTERIPLPAPPIATSLTPNEAPPYSVYNLEARLEGYYGQSYVALPIFDGITAIQPIQLIPFSENGKQDLHRPEEDIFFESEPPTL